LNGPGGDGDDIICGHFVTEVVDERDVDWPPRPSGFANHCGALGARKILVAPLLEHADE
jgi:hypothetical protein